MDQTVQLLQDVVRNARTGENAIQHLMKKTGEGEMRSELERERREYAGARQAGEQALRQAVRQAGYVVLDLRQAGGSAEPSGPLEQAGMWMGLEMETLADRSDEHIAEIVIQGATMGVIEMTKALNACDSAAPVARSLASSFVVQQSEAIDRQKGFLR